MKKAIKRILTILAIIVGICVLFVAFFAVKGAVLWNNARKDKPLDQIVERYQSSPDFVKYDEMREFYINAVISVEDRRFFEHCGINPKSIARAALYDVKTLSFAQGGSTITQQLAKNLWFSEEKRLERKFAEIYAAFALEKALSKEEIFELYANSIYFGSDYYGVAAAAEGYFAKEPSELSDYECALLAGIPNAPSAYSPNESPELAMQRVELVLDSMVSNGAITADDERRIMGDQSIDRLKMSLI